jgi:hypothetical protein
MDDGKWNPRQFLSIRLHFVNCASGSFLFVRLLTKKQTEVILNGLNGLNGLAHLCICTGAAVTVKVTPSCFEALDIVE